MSSNLLVEAMYLEKPVFSVLTRASEKEWMHELKMNFIHSVCNREDLNNLLNDVFKKRYPKSNLYPKDKNKNKSIKEILSNLKI